VDGLYGSGARWNSEIRAIQGVRDGLSAVKARLEQEAKIWVNVWKQPLSRRFLAGDYALLMSYVEPVPLDAASSPIRSPGLDTAVYSATIDDIQSDQDQTLHFIWS